MTTPTTKTKKNSTTDTSGRYIETIGRRKTATARVRMTPASKTAFSVNGKSLLDYFKQSEYVRVAKQALEEIKDGKDYTVTVVVKGGGMHAQAEAIRHGISRGIVEEDETRKAELRKLGFIKRDPRAKERRKFGLKKARKSPQWSKR